MGTIGNAHSYDSALENLVDLITDNYTARLARDLAAKFDDGDLFDVMGSTRTERDLWEAITDLADWAGEDAEVVVDDAACQAGYGEDEEEDC